MSYYNVWAEVVFLRFSKKGDVYTNLTMPIFCTSSNSITSLSFRCWSIPVSEIREFNRKKKEKKKKKMWKTSAIPIYPVLPYWVIITLFALKWHTGI